MGTPAAATGPADALGMKRLGTLALLTATMFLSHVGTSSLSLLSWLRLSEIPHPFSEGTLTLGNTLMSAVGPPLGAVVTLFVSRKSVMLAALALTLSGALLFAVPNGPVLVAGLFVYQVGRVMQIAGLWALAVEAMRGVGLEGRCAGLTVLYGAMNLSYVFAPELTFFVHGRLGFGGAHAFAVGATALALVAAGVAAWLLPTTLKPAAGGGALSFYRVAVVVALSAPLTIMMMLLADLRSNGLSSGSESLMRTLNPAVVLCTALALASVLAVLEATGRRISMGLLVLAGSAGYAIAAGLLSTAAAEHPVATLGSVTVAAVAEVLAFLPLMALMIDPERPGVLALGVSVHLATSYLASAVGLLALTAASKAFVGLTVAVLVAGLALAGLSPWLERGARGESPHAV